MASTLDIMAKKIFEAAIREERCGELLLALFNGAKATVDKDSGLLVIAKID